MATKKRGLGRGLEALLGTSKPAAAAAEDVRGDSMRTLEIGLLHPGRYQPRTGMDPERLTELAESIKAQGVIQPIVVRETGRHKYEIIAGERRWRAAQLAGLADVPVVVREVDDRAVIAIGTSAGSGTVDPGEVTPLEYLLNGDVATASTQYSILPSFLSFAVDRPNSVTESVAVLDAVRDRLEAVPAVQRPRLVVFGESLGAYGANGAFANLDDLIEMTDGAMFQGPPNATAMWRDYTDQRQPGTPEHLPVYDAGTHLRWANQPSDLSQPPTPFRAPRAVYLQNASDPVVWWSPDVLWARPDWLGEPRGPGVLTWPWLPVITFAGLSGDMMNSQGVPAGHGHVYGTDPVAAWADILRPAGWSAADTARLEQHLGG